MSIINIEILWCQGLQKCNQSLWTYSRKHFPLNILQQHLNITHCMKSCSIRLPHPPTFPDPTVPWYGIKTLMFASRHVRIKNLNIKNIKHKKLLEPPYSIYKSLLTSPGNKTWCDHLYVFHHKTFTQKYDIKISTHSGVVHHTDEWCSTFRHAHFILFYCGTVHIEN